MSRLPRRHHRLAGCEAIQLTVMTNIHVGYAGRDAAGFEID
jgi:hypothetical protein